MPGFIGRIWYNSRIYWGLLIQVLALIKVLVDNVLVDGKAMEIGASMTKVADKVLVTDFDGTVTRKDFYSCVVETCLSPEDLEPWELYTSGKITHFEALRRIFERIRVPVSGLAQVVEAMEVDPQLSEAVDRLHNAGWDVIVVSNGSSWYVEKLLARAGVSVPVHSNPGTYSPETGLVLELPTDSPYFCEETGVRKGSVIKDMIQRGRKVAFAGDGRPDVEPAMLVPPEHRFAREWLAEFLSEQNEEFQPFDVWSDIANYLVA